MNKNETTEDLKQLEQQMRQIERQLSRFDTQLVRMDQGIAALQQLSTQKKADILVQVADGIFVNATVTNPKDIILAVGADVAVQKDVNDMILLLQQQKEISVQYQNKLIEKMEELAYKADELAQKEAQASKKKGR